MSRTIITGNLLIFALGTMAYSRNLPPWDRVRDDVSLCLAACVIAILVKLIVLARRSQSSVAWPSMLDRSVTGALLLIDILLLTLLGAGE